MYPICFFISRCVLFNFMNIASFVDIAFIAFCRRPAFYSNVFNKGF
jgi:hypothetical protein